MITTAQDKLPLNNRPRIGSAYQLEEEISRGSVASIYRAIALENSQPVAIKLFNARYHADPRFAIRFREHLRRLVGITHENLVSIFDYGIDQNRYYIVMEWVDGTDLGNYLSEYGLLTPDWTIFIATQVCGALEAIHTNGLVHQGIKPQNILLTSGGQVKLTDVGLSRLLSDSGLSQTHVMLGGVGYIPPEQVRGKGLVPQSDIYSLGVTMFEMLTGRLPFEARDAWSLVRMHVVNPPPSSQQFNQQVPEGLANIVTRALQKDPEVRFPSATEMKAALATLEKESGVVFLQDQRGRARETGYIALFKNLLKPDALSSLLLSPWKIAGFTLPFGVILIFQFFITCIIAYIFLFILVGFF